MRKLSPMTKREKDQDSTFWRFIFVFLLIYMCISFFIKPMTTSGPSMEPTFTEGDFILCNRINKAYTYDDIVVVKIMTGLIPKNIIKRVVGVPGDTLYVKNGELYINNVKEERGFPKINDAGILNSPITLGENEYFILGDNRNNSNDSRNIGPVTKIDGKVISTGINFK